MEKRTLLNWQGPVGSFLRSYLYVHYEETGQRNNTAGEYLLIHVPFHELFSMEQTTPEKRQAVLSKMRPTLHELKQRLDKAIRYSSEHPTAKLLSYMMLPQARKAWHKRTALSKPELRKLIETGSVIAAVRSEELLEHELYICCYMNDIEIKNKIGESLSFELKRKKALHSDKEVTARYILKMRKRDALVAEKHVKHTIPRGACRGEWRPVDPEQMLQIALDYIHEHKLPYEISFDYRKQMAAD